MQEERGRKTRAGSWGRLAPGTTAPGCRGSRPEQNPGEGRPLAPRSQDGRCWPGTGLQGHRLSYFWPHTWVALSFSVISDSLQPHGQ